MDSSTGVVAVPSRSSEMPWNTLAWIRVFFFFSLCSTHAWSRAIRRDVLRLITPLPRHSLSAGDRRAVSTRSATRKLLIGFLIARYAAEQSIGDQSMRQSSFSLTVDSIKQAYLISAWEVCARVDRPPRCCRFGCAVHICTDIKCLTSIMNLWMHVEPF